MELRPGEKIIEEEGFDNYRLYMISHGNKHTFIVFMKVQFFFEDDDSNKWKTNEKEVFVQSWVTAIQGKWNSPRFMNTKQGAQVGLEFRFKTKIGGWMWDHWELTVKKIPKGNFGQSWVRDGSWRNNTSQLDSEDLSFTRKGTRPAEKQRGAVHEFGHMLGLDDEYETSSAHQKDSISIMHSGEAIRQRHSRKLSDWVKSAAKEHGF